MNNVKKVIMVSKKELEVVIHALRKEHEKVIKKAGGTHYGPLTRQELETLIGYLNQELDPKEYVHII